MDDTEYSGTADEFLSMGSEPVEEAVPTPDDAETPSLSQDADSADAADETEAEDDDLSPAERVAAVLAQDAAESGQEPEPEAAQTDAAESPDDLSTLSPEELLKLAQEALELRAKLAEGDVDREQQELEGEIAHLDGQTVDRVQAAYQREVLAVSKAHYGRLRNEASERLDEAAESQREMDPREYKRRYRDAYLEPISDAQRTWEAKKAAEWEGVLDAEISAARKQNPRLRKRYAEMLCTHAPDGQGGWTPRPQPLPKRAVDEILKVQNTDDMPTAAQMMVDSVRAHASQKRASNQQLRDEAAKRVAAAPLASPSTGRPKPAKKVEFKGEAEEWLEIRRQMART